MMKIMRSLLLIICISFTVGCAKQVIPVELVEVDSSNELNGSESNEIIEDEYVLVYSSINEKKSGSQAEKWMRDNGYTIKKDGKIYHLIRKDHIQYNGINKKIDISTKIGVGSTYIGGDLYDKYSQDVGSLTIANGVFYIEITREGRLKRVPK